MVRVVRFCLFLKKEYCYNHERARETGKGKSSQFEHGRIVGSNVETLTKV